MRSTRATNVVVIMRSSALARSSSCSCSCSSSSAAFGKRLWGRQKETTKKGDQRKARAFLSKREKKMRRKRKGSAARAMMPTAEEDRAIMTEENTSSLPSIYKSEDGKEQQVLRCAQKCHRPRFWREHRQLRVRQSVENIGRRERRRVSFRTHHSGVPGERRIQQTLERVRETIGVGR